MPVRIGRHSHAQRLDLERFVFPFDAEFSEEG